MSKSDTKAPSSEAILKQVLDQLNKKYGEGTVQDFSKETIVEVETITTGLPSLDLILGGGIPKGRLIEIFGPESAGKTTMALHILSKCQQTGKRAAFIDAENAFDPLYAQTLGVRVEELIVNQPDSGEEALDIVEKLCQSGVMSIIVVDSVAALVPQSTLAKEIDGTMNIGTRARMLSDSIARLGNVAAKSGTTIIFINQIRMKIGVMYGNPETTPGGKALKFHASIRLEVRAQKPERRNGVEGCFVKANVKKNKIARPFQKTELFLQYGIGFDIVDDTLALASKLGVIEKTGGWFRYEDTKIKGWDNFCEAIRADEKVLCELMETVKGVQA